MVAFDQWRDDRSAERERVSVARWLLAMKLPSLLLFDCRHCYFMLFLVWKHSTSWEVRSTKRVLCAARTLALQPVRAQPRDLWCAALP
jgi:hypothetical protein